MHLIASTAHSWPYVLQCQGKKRLRGEKWQGYSNKGKWTQKLHKAKMLQFQNFKKTNTVTTHSGIQTTNRTTTCIYSYALCTSPHRVKYMHAGYVLLFSLCKVSGKGKRPKSSPLRHVAGVCLAKRVYGNWADPFLGLGGSLKERSLYSMKNGFMLMLFFPLSHWLHGSSVTNETLTVSMHETQRLAQRWQLRKHKTIHALKLVCLYS